MPGYQLVLCLEWENTKSNAANAGTMCHAMKNGEDCMKIKLHKWSCGIGLCVLLCLLAGCRGLADGDTDRGTGTVAFCVSGSEIHALASRAAHDHPVSGLYTLTVSLKGGYEETKSVTLDETSTAQVLFEGIRIGTTVYAEAYLYITDGNVLIYKGTSNPITVTAYENRLGLSLNAVGSWILLWNKKETEGIAAVSPSGTQALAGLSKGLQLFRNVSAGMEVTSPLVSWDSLGGLVFCFDAYGNLYVYTFIGVSKVLAKYTYSESGYTLAGSLTAPTITGMVVLNGSLCISYKPLSTSSNNLIGRLPLDKLDGATTAKSLIDDDLELDFVITTDVFSPDSSSTFSLAADDTYLYAVTVSSSSVNVSRYTVQEENDDDGDGNVTKVLKVTQSGSTVSLNLAGVIPNFDSGWGINLPDALTQNGSLFIPFYVTAYQSARGGILKVNLQTFSFTPWKDGSYALGWYAGGGSPPQGSAYFVMPTKFIARRPKELVLADDGAYYYSVTTPYPDGTGSSTDNYVVNSNRVITVNLLTESYTASDVHCMFSRQLDGSGNLN